MGRQGLPGHPEVGGDKQVLDRLQGTEEQSQKRAKQGQQRHPGPLPSLLPPQALSRGLSAPLDGSLHVVSSVAIAGGQEVMTGAAGPPQPQSLPDVPSATPPPPVAKLPLGTARPGNPVAPGPVA